MSRIVSFLVLVAIIGLIGFLFFRVMAPFLLPLFLAVLLVVIFHPLHRWILAKCRQRPYRAAACTTLLIMLIVLLPLLIVLFQAAAEGRAMVTRLNPEELRHKVGRARDQFPLLQMPHATLLREIDTDLAALNDSGPVSLEPRSSPLLVERLISLLDQLRMECKITSERTGPLFDSLRERLTRIRDALPDRESSQEEAAAARREFHDLKSELLGGEFRVWAKELANPTDEELRHTVRHLLESTRGTLFSLGGRTTAWLGRLVVGLFIMVVAMFFFLAEGPAMIRTIMHLSPLNDQYEQELLADFATVSRAVVVATLLSAAVQALLAGIGYYVAGFQSVMLLTMVTGLLAMIPFVGTPAVWAPAALWLYFFEERAGAAVLLAIYGVTVVSSVDNLIKPWVLHGRSRLHPLLALLSVLGGVNALGPIGILVGPMLVAFLQTLLNILHRELSQFDGEPRGEGG